MDGPMLTPRHEEVLGEAVRSYIETGEPVSSRSIVERHAEPLSPATIRNVMADLEEAGLLFQPHTSAGRIPTAAGYRYFIDRFAVQARLSVGDQLWIRREMDATRGYQQAVGRAAHILAKVSHGLGLILSPPIGLLRLEHIRFLLVPDGRVLVVVLSPGGRTRDKLIRPDRRFAQDELDRIADHVNRNYAGWTIAAIRADLTARLAREEDSYGLLARQALDLCDPQLFEEEGGRQLVLEGTAEIAAAPEFADPSRLSQLLNAIEEKRRLIELLSACLAGPEPVSVRIGLREIAVAGSDLALISAQFSVAGQAPGTLGILGPLRMDYERAITATAYLAERVGSTLTGATTP